MTSAARQCDRCDRCDPDPLAGCCELGSAPGPSFFSGRRSVRRSRAPAPRRRVATAKTARSATDPTSAAERGTPLQNTPSPSLDRHPLLALRRKDFRGPGEATSKFTKTRTAERSNSVSDLARTGQGVTALSALPAGTSAMPHLAPWNIFSPSPAASSHRRTLRCTVLRCTLGKARGLHSACRPVPRFLGSSMEPGPTDFPVNHLVLCISSEIDLRHCAISRLGT